MIADSQRGVTPGKSQGKSQGRSQSSKRVDTQPSNKGKKQKTVAPGAKTEIAKGSAPKRKSSSLWVGIGLFILLICAAGIFITRNNLIRRMLVGERPTTVAVASVTPTQVVEATIEVTATLPSVVEVPEVAAAREAVQKDPGDPIAHLQLSLAMWDDGQKNPAYEALAQAANLAGTDKEFFMEEVE